MAKKLTSDQKRYQEYVDSLYTKEEQNRIRKKITQLRGKNNEIAKYQSHTLEVWISDYLILMENYRLLKKHFKLSDAAANRIINKMRALSPFEEKFVNFMGLGNNEPKRKKK